jgi:hypothetical protein
MSRIEQSNEESNWAQLDIKYCPGCECMIETWWNYCGICGFHIAGGTELPADDGARDRVWAAGLIAQQQRRRLRTKAAV